MFSCIAGFLGVATVAWYGFAKVSDEIYDDARRQIAEAGVTQVPTGEPVPAAQEVVVTSGGGGGARA